MHLIGWSWGSCTLMIGRVGGIICSLQYHLRPERSRLSPAMYLQDLCMLPWNGSLSYTVFGNKCSRMFLVIFHILPHVKVKTWFTTHVTHTLWNRPCQQLAFFTEWKPTKPIPIYFKKLAIRDSQYKSKWNITPADINCTPGQIRISRHPRHRNSKCKFRKCLSRLQ